MARRGAYRSDKRRKDLDRLKKQEEKRQKRFSREKEAEEELQEPAEKTEGEMKNDDKPEEEA